MNERQDDTKIILQPVADRLIRQKIKIEVVSGSDLGKSVVVGDKLLHIGTQIGNSVELTDRTVSGIHVELRVTNGGVKLKDLSSTNGTWIEGVRITEGIVPFGTTLRLGNTKLRVLALDEHVTEPLSPSFKYAFLIGRSAAMRSLFMLLERVSPTDETVLITGETGTGKDVCARSIVETSRRKDKPYVVVDCGAIPPNLLESELFGHARGAFTGAVSEHRGAFERAQGGTVFLDEIGELPLSLQTRLLRAVENRQVRRIGDGRDIPLDIRILAATNRCLEEEVNRGTFRPDLYYRLSVVQIRLPPLRERVEDIEMLATHFLCELENGALVSLNETLLNELRTHRWPGNIRELRNHLRRIALGEVANPTAPAGQPEIKEPCSIDLSIPFKDCKMKAIEQFERTYLSALMKACHGNISKAARTAQTDRTYLSRLLTKYSISDAL